MIVDPRELDKRITLQQPTRAKEGNGGTSVTWSDLDTVWAKVRHLSGNEKSATSKGGEVAVARTEIIIRYQPDITEKSRVAYRGKVFNIRHVNNVREADEWLILTCDTGNG